jgi:50S ribosomal protein L16 3-hydroxylase
MTILDEIFPDGRSQLFSKEIPREPIAVSSSALRFCKFRKWDVLHEIFQNGHRDCWLVNAGQHVRPSDVPLTFERAYQGFSDGHTVVVRHAEMACSSLYAVALEFKKIFDLPIDIQLYCTPQDQVGFDWHYDVEDVFVIQTSGQKEFMLRRNVDTHPPLFNAASAHRFQSMSIGPQINCRLHAGDVLFIPSGYWHKAKALTPSFHFSVGVMNRA